MHNYVYTEKLKSIEAGDAQALINHLQNRQAQDAMFYYSVQLDQESYLTDVFWRDGKYKTDFTLWLWFGTHIRAKLPNYEHSLASTKFQRK